MFVKLIGAAAFIAAGAAAGASRSVKLREECSKCREICDMLRNISTYIRYTGSDVYKIVSQLKAEQTGLCFVYKLPESFASGQNFHSLWHSALSDEQLDEDERDILEELGSLLGTSDIEGQLSVLSVLEARAEHLMAQRMEAYERKGKMYRSVGVLAGVMIGILVI